MPAPWNLWNSRIKKAKKSEVTGKGVWVRTKPGKQRKTTESSRISPVFWPFPPKFWPNFTFLTILFVYPHSYRRQVNNNTTSSYQNRAILTHFRFLFRSAILGVRRNLKHLMTTPKTPNHYQTQHQNSMMMMMTTWWWLPNTTSFGKSPNWTRVDGSKYNTSWTQREAKMNTQLSRLGMGSAVTVGCFALHELNEKQRWTHEYCNVMYHT